LQSHQDEADKVFAGKWYTRDSTDEALEGDFPSKLEYLAGQFLNSPYLWGGRSAFGTDCSGLVQTIFRILGTGLERDTNRQHRQGSTVNLISESGPGDLVFFDDEEGNIVHVGLLMDQSHVLHASGHVRIDPIDHQGIYNELAGTYSHKLRLIKRIID